MKEWTFWSDSTPCLGQWMLGYSEYGTYQVLYCTRDEQTREYIATNTIGESVKVQLWIEIPEPPHLDEYR